MDGTSAGSSDAASVLTLSMSAGDGAAAARVSFSTAFSGDDGEPKGIDDSAASSPEPDLPRADQPLER
jgi:hypothetical protein